MTEKSGPQWCGRFPTSARLEDLAPPFRDNATSFVGAMLQGGASVTISATYRPAERAYLMHWCCKIAGYKDKVGNWIQVAPSKVPLMAGVDIDWTHGGNSKGAIAAAAAMRTAYNIAFPAALVSRHTQRRAIDMTIGWKGTLNIRNRAGTLLAITAEPRNGNKNTDLHAVGASYGVHKLLSDPPHWSDDGR